MIPADSRPVSDRPAGMSLPDTRGYHRLSETQGPIAGILDPTPMLIRLILLFLILDWFFNLLFNVGHYWIRWW